jgi:putative endonuclease
MTGWSFVILSRTKWRKESKVMNQLRNMNNYYVYIMTNNSKTLYTGMTNDLTRRVYEHKQKLTPGFTQKYNITKLVYFEETSDVNAAISREKQIKGWLREKKITLIELMNPEWKDLSVGWYD